MLGTCNVNISCKGKEVLCKVYVVPFGMPLMGLDLMEKFAVDVVANEVCRVLQPDPSDPVTQPAAQPAQLPDTSHHPSLGISTV